MIRRFIEDRESVLVSTSEFEEIRGIEAIRRGIAQMEAGKGATLLRSHDARFKRRFRFGEKNNSGSILDTYRLDVYIHV